MLNVKYCLFLLFNIYIFALKMKAKCLQNVCKVVSTKVSNFATLN